MKKHSKKAFFFFVLPLLLLTQNSCIKSMIEPDIDGVWVQIDNTTNKALTGCELNINKSSGDVMLCNTAFIHPYNVFAAFLPEKAKLIIEDGQMHFKQKRVDFLFIPMPGHEDHYFLDYDFDGEYLWIIEENTSAKTSAKNVGLVFKRP